MIEAADLKKLEKALCGRCSYILAMRGNSEVSVKSGELYFYFYSGMLIVICRGCAASNLILEEEYEIQNAEKVKALLSRANVIRAEYGPWKSRKEKENERTNIISTVTSHIAGESKNVQ